MRRVVRSYQILFSAMMALSCANRVQGATPDLAITPLTLDFKYDAGNTLPAAQTLQIKSTGAALSFTISITGPLPYSAEWLSVSTLAGTTSASLNVYVNPTSLPSHQFAWGKLHRLYRRHGGVCCHARAYHTHHSGGRQCAFNDIHKH
jgi:hypothetical protein